MQTQHPLQQAGSISCVISACGVAFGTWVVSLCPEESTPSLWGLLDVHEMMWHWGCSPLGAISTDQSAASPVMYLWGMDGAGIGQGDNRMWSHPYHLWERFLEQTARAHFLGGTWSSPEQGQGITCQLLNWSGIYAIQNCGDIHWECMLDAEQVCFWWIHTSLPIISIYELSELREWQWQL